MEELVYVFEDGESGIGELVEAPDEFDFLKEEYGDDLEDELYIEEMNDEWDWECGEWDLS